MKKLFIVTLMFLVGISLVPRLSFAQNTDVPATPVDQTGSQLNYSGFVKCDGVVKTDGSEPYRQTPCDFATLMNTVNKGINWLFFISIPIAATLFAYAGLLYMSGIPDKRKKANGIFTSVAIGFIIMLTAWLIVRTAVGWFVKPTVNATIFLDSTSK